MEFYIDTLNNNELAVVKKILFYINNKGSFEIGHDKLMKISNITNYADFQNLLSNVRKKIIRIVDQRKGKTIIFGFFDEVEIFNNSIKFYFSKDLIKFKNGIKIVLSNVK